MVSKILGTVIFLVLFQSASAKTADLWSLAEESPAKHLSCICKNPEKIFGDQGCPTDLSVTLSDGRTGLHNAYGAPGNYLIVNMDALGSQKVDQSDLDREGVPKVQSNYASSHPQYPSGKNLGGILVRSLHLAKDKISKWDYFTAAQLKRVKNLALTLPRFDVDLFSSIATTIEEGHLIVNSNAWATSTLSPRAITKKYKVTYEFAQKQLMGLKYEVDTQGLDSITDQAAKNSFELFEDAAEFDTSGIPSGNSGHAEVVCH